MRTVPLLLLAACLSHQPPVRAPEPVPLGVALVLESFDHPEVTGAPESVVERLAEEATSRNLVPSPLPVDPEFARIRSTEGRLARLGDGPHLLLEFAPRFSAQVNGRYRWTVDVTATVDPPRATREFTVPVHLLYAHQKEEDALVEASPVIAREVGELLDEWVEGR
jgi:hypothetical protein